jgi:two-component system chemotaxis response regulator CheY
MVFRVLLVDDSAAVRQLHSFILHSGGFETAEADSGFAALELLHRQPCDLVVIDLNMPRMDGLTLIRQIRADTTMRDLPIIIVSTEQDVHDQIKGFEAGANIYMIKPTEPDLLVTQARMLMGRAARSA